MLSTSHRPNIFRPGDVFGELFLGQYRHRIGEAQALEDVVGRLCEETVLDLIQRLPRVARLLAHQDDCRQRPRRTYDPPRCRFRRADQPRQR